MEYRFPKCTANRHDITLVSFQRGLHDQSMNACLAKLTTDCVIVSVISVFSMHPDNFPGESALAEFLDKISSLSDRGHKVAKPVAGSALSISWFVLGC